MIASPKDQRTRAEVLRATLDEMQRAEWVDNVAVLRASNEVASADMLLAFGAWAVIRKSGNRIDLMSGDFKGIKMNHPEIVRVIHAAGEELVSTLVESSLNGRWRLGGSKFKCFHIYWNHPKNGSSNVDVDVLAGVVAGLYRTAYTNTEVGLRQLTAHTRACGGYGPR